MIIRQPSCTERPRRQNCTFTGFAAEFRGDLCDEINFGLSREALKGSSTPRFLLDLTPHGFYHNCKALAIHFALTIIGR